MFTSRVYYLADGGGDTIPTLLKTEEDFSAETESSDTSETSRARIHQAGGSSERHLSSSSSPWSVDGLPHRAERTARGWWSGMELVCGTTQRLKKKKKKNKEEEEAGLLWTSS